MSLGQLLSMLVQKLCVTLLKIKNLIPVCICKTLNNSLLFLAHILVDFRFINYACHLSVILFLVKNYRNQKLS